MKKIVKTTFKIIGWAIFYLIIIYSLFYAASFNSVG